MDRNFMFILAAVIGVLGLIFVLAGGKEESSDNVFVGNPAEVQDNDFKIGAGTGGVQLIEFADFECPSCSALHRVTQVIEQEYGDQIQHVFRHFPLQSIHPNATAAHRAAQAAGNQGMFWEMHDLLFERQPTWSAAGSGFNVAQANDVFEQFATELGLDLEQFQADVASEETFNFIDTQIDSGNQLGINGTPTLYLNGTRIDTPRSLDEFRAVIDSALETAGQTDEADTNEENAAETQPAEATP